MERRRGVTAARELMPMSQNCDVHGYGLRESRRVFAPSAAATAIAPRCNCVSRAARPPQNTRKPGNKRENEGASGELRGRKLRCWLTLYSATWC
jgi:hypothetical protein